MWIKNREMEIERGRIRFVGDEWSISCCLFGSNRKLKCFVWSENCTSFPFYSSPHLTRQLCYCLDFRIFTDFDFFFFSLSQEKCDTHILVKFNRLLTFFFITFFKHENNGSAMKQWSERKTKHINFDVMNSISATM